MSTINFDNNTNEDTPEPLIEEAKNLIKEVKEISKVKSFNDIAKEKELDSEISDDLKTVSLKRTVKFTNVGKKTKEDYYPDDDELEIINKSSNIDLKASDVLVFTLISADSEIDRQNEKFTDKALKTAAELSVDKAFLIDHNWETKDQIGKIFSATTANGKLLQKVYVLNDPINYKYTQNILAGIYNKVSVGFSASLSDLVCSACKTKSIYDPECPHMPGMPDEEGIRVYVEIKNISDYYEVSLVPVPAQKAAGIRREMSLNKSQQELIESVVLAVLPETIENPEALLKSIEVLVTPVSSLSFVENKEETDLNIINPTICQSNCKDSDTINNSESNLGENPVSEENTQKELETPAELLNDLTAPVEDPKAPVEEANSETDPTETTTENSNSVLIEVVNELNKTVSELKDLVTKQQEVLSKSEEAYKNLKEVNEEKSEQLANQVTELNERFDILCGVVESAVSTNLETVVMEAASKTQNKSTTTWFQELNNGFLSGGQ
jgi:hypothetical protein